MSDDQMIKTYTTDNPSSIPNMTLALVREDDGGLTLALSAQR